MDLVIGPNEAIDDELYGKKASYGAYVLLKNFDQHRIFQIGFVAVGVHALHKLDLVVVCAADADIGVADINGKYLHENCCLSLDCCCL